MGRKRVQHKFITNDVARKITFKKRKAGLLKKLQEITTLCGVVSFGIIFHNFNKNGKEDQPLLEAWPSVPEAVDSLEKMKALPLKKQKKYMSNYDSLLETCLEKKKEKLKNEIEKTRWLEIESLVMDADDDYMKGVTSSASDEDLDHHMELKRKSEMLRASIKKIDEQIEYLENENKDE